jgi:predicted nuclease of predicted toxin-antitoxin system
VRLLIDHDLSHKLVAGLADAFPIWIKRGNCSTRDTELLLRRERADIEAFERDLEASFLVVE